MLAFVTGERADGGTGAGFAAGVGDFGAEQRAQPRFHESPCAHVFRLFLAPDELCVLWKRLEHFAQFLFRERIELLDPDNGSIVNLSIIPVLQKVVIDFAGTKDDALHIIYRWNAFSRLRRGFGGQAERTAQSVNTKTKKPSLWHVDDHRP